jgi:hypothetical protein
MSPEERDAVVGRTIREKSDLQRDLAVTDKLLADVAADLRTLAVFISEQTAAIPSQSALPALSALHKHADFSKIAGLLDERKKTANKLQSAITQLTAMGVIRE